MEQLNVYVSNWEKYSTKSNEEINLISIERELSLMQLSI